jgi:hypothetical protein
VALTVLLLLAGLPCASVACQWICAPQSAHAHAQPAHHHPASPSTAPAQNQNMGVSQVTSVPAACDHAGATAPSTAAVTLHTVAAVVSTPVTAMMFGMAPDRNRPGVSGITQRPPGGSSTSVSLRI